MAQVKNVSYAKPKVGGAVSVAPIGTELPLNAIDELTEAYKNMGYISEDGMTNENRIDTEVIKAWGGDTVLPLQTGKEDTFATTFIEALNVEVLKFIYGKDNVTGDLSTGITIKANSTPLSANVIVVDTVLVDGVLKRLVIPHGVVSEIGEIVYKDNEEIGYEVTIQALPDADGNTHYEHIQEAAV